MSAYASLQEREFEVAQDHGYSAVRHRRFVGAGYFSEVRGGLRRSQFHRRAGAGIERASPYFCP